MNRGESGEHKGSPFDPAFLEELERLAALARRLRSGVATERDHQAGAVFDWRPYREGDPSRIVDWAAYARFDRLVSRLYESEHPRDALLLLDTSRSMVEAPAVPERAEALAGTRTRWVLQVAAALGQVLLASGARLEVCSFSGGGLGSRRVCRGERASESMLGMLAHLRFEGGGGPPLALERLAAERRGRALAVLVSDLLWPGDPGSVFGRWRAGGAELAVALLEPPAFGGRPGPIARLIDAETGEALCVRLDRASLEAYQRALEAHVAAVRRAAARTAARFALLAADTPPVAAALDALRAGLLR